MMTTRLQHLSCPTLVYKVPRLIDFNKLLGEGVLREEVSRIRSTSNSLSENDLQN
jgi:hypothetical protein